MIEDLISFEDVDFPRFRDNEITVSETEDLLTHTTPRNLNNGLGRFINFILTSHGEKQNRQNSMNNRG